VNRSPQFNKILKVQSNSFHFSKICLLRTESVQDIILPNLTHWQHPNFFAFFPANASYPSILGELLSSGLGVQGMIWV
jgi:glutamate/tyrosine decarboxylase-like PLP-dependent enzyme